MGGPFVVVAVVMVVVMVMRADAHLQRRAHGGACAVLDVRLFVRVSRTTKTPPRLDRAALSQDTRLAAPARTTVPCFTPREKADVSHIGPKRRTKTPNQIRLLRNLSWSKVRETRLVCAHSRMLSGDL
jgi:hypothetical protein